MLEKDLIFTENNVIMLPICNYFYKFIISHMYCGSWNSPRTIAKNAFLASRHYKRSFSMKKPLKIALYLLLALVLIVLAYVIYVFAAYYRVEDMQKLGVAHCDAASAAPMEGAPQTGVTYRVSSANVGFGAYSADYSFFMDGGKESRARSRQAVDENMRGEVSLVKDLSPDFALFQEVDIYGTRSWHIAEDAYLSDVMENSEFNEVFAQNYDSPYLFYPLINPLSLIHI